jgi:mediator of RNA polymerase II transcription subunit 17
MEEVGENDENPPTDTPLEVVEEEKQDFDAARQELAQLVGQAQNESALSLDFVSLLLSVLRPAAGSTSMSPHLKHHVPVGSLGADQLSVEPPKEDRTVGGGWKVQSLGKASELLKNSAGRLKSEIDKERKYWINVRKTANAGEVLFKIRKGDARGLGIKYGFGDAGSEYGDKGIAMIKRRHDGSMSFKFDKAKRSHVVKVSLYDTSSGDHELIGCSRYKDLLLSEHSVQEEIKNARSLVFEEELFYEIVREARRLSSHKVSVVAGKVVINLYDEDLVVELVDPTVEEEEERDEDEGGAENNPHSYKADLICNAFHILLCYAHRRNLQKRRTVPAPVSSKAKPPQSPLFILRPIIAHILHSKVLKRTTRLLEMILQSHQNSSMSLEKYSDIKSKNQHEYENSYLGTLLFPPVSTYHLDTGNGISVTIITSSPLLSYIPLYDVTAKKGPDQVLSKTGFYELNELEDWINWILKK